MATITINLNEQELAAAQRLNTMRLKDAQNLEQLRAYAEAVDDFSSRLVARALLELEHAGLISRKPATGGEG